MCPILVVSGRNTPQSDSLYGGPPRFADGAAEHKFWMSYQTTSTPVPHDPDWPPSRVVAVEQQEMKWAHSQLERSYRQHSQTVSEIRSEASLSVLTCQVASIEVTEVTEVPPEAEAGRGPHEETLVLRPAFVRWIVLPGELSLTHGLAPVTRLFPRGEGVKTALLDELMASTAPPSVTNLTVQRWHF